MTVRSWLVHIVLILTFPAILSIQSPWRMAMCGRCFLEQLTTDLMRIREGRIGHRERYSNETTQALKTRLMQTVRTVTLLYVHLFQRGLLGTIIDGRNETCARSHTAACTDCTRSSRSSVRFLYQYRPSQTTTVMTSRGKAIARKSNKASWFMMRWSSG